MARQVLPIVGAVVGSFIPGVGPQIGFAIGSIIGNVVDPQVIKGPSIGEGQATTTQEGLPRPIVWGAGVVGANIIDRGELKKTTKRTKQSKGGPVQEEEQFHITYAIRICEGPIVGIVRIWEDEKLVYDIRPDGISQVSHLDNAKFARGFRLYLGDEEQMPDPALEAIHGVGNTPAYRGTAYIVFENKNVTHRGGSIPNYRFEVLAGGGSVNNIGDFVFSSFAAREDNDGYELSPSFPSNLPISGGVTSSKNSVITKDGKYLLNGAGANSSGGVYKRDLDTGIFYRIGNLGDVIQNWPGYTANGFTYYFDITPDGKTIACLHWHSSQHTTNDLIIIKYNETTESFYVTDTVNTQHSSETRPVLSINASGTRVCVGKRSPNGYERYFFSSSGMYLDFYQRAVTGSTNVPEFCVIPVGEKAPLECVLGMNNVPGWIEQVYFGVHSETTPVTERRSLSSDFPGYIFDTASFYYSESAKGFPKAVFFARKLNENGNGYHLCVLSYSITKSVLIPGDPIPSLVPNVEWVGGPFSGGIRVAAGGHTNSITGLSFTGSPGYQRPNDLAPGTSARFYKFVHNDDGSISLDKYQDIPNTYSGLSSTSYVQAPNDIQRGNTGDGISYKWFIDDVCSRSDIPASKLDTDEMADYTIRGVVAAQQYTAAEVIRATQPVFPIDVADYDRQIHFTKRGKPAVAAITIDDIVDGTYDSTRKEAIAYPRKLNLVYQHQRTGYIAAKATVERISPDVRVSGETTTQVPVVMDEHQAAKAADILLKTTWTDLEGEVEFSVPTSFDFLTVGDCVAIYPRSGQQFRMRIDTIERADGILSIKGKIDRQSSYGSQATGLPIPDPTPPPPTTVGPTRLAYLDIPALTDADDALVYYVAVNGETEAWSGGETQRRVVPDDFEEVARSGRGQCVGTLDAALGTGPEHYADTFNSVYVYFPGGEMNAPQSVTDDQLLREQNVLAISRPDGSAELVQFRDVEDLGDGHYKLSYLLRGRLYTGVSAHPAGTTVTLLDYGVSKITVDAALLDATWEHRAISFGESPETAPVRVDTFAARSQVEFPPGLLTAERSGGDVVVSWSHAFRFGSDIHPVDSVNRTGYFVEVSDGSGSVTATLDANAQTATLDVSALSGPLTVSVSGINRYTGNGIPSTVNIA